MAVCILVNGWLDEQEDVESMWAFLPSVVVPGGLMEFYSLAWESEVLRDFGHALGDFAKAHLTSALSILPSFLQLPKELFFFAFLFPSVHRMFALPFLLLPVNFLFVFFYFRSAVASQALQRTILASLLAAVTLPLFLLKLSGVIDNPWSVSLNHPPTPPPPNSSISSIS